MPDLTTSYMGLELTSPIVASPSPLTKNIDDVRALHEAGVGAVVMPSLFEEEIIHEEGEIAAAYDQTANFFAESLDFFPEVEGITSPCDRYLATLADLKKAVPIPVIGSLNAVSSGGWARYAKLMQEAGADAIELNLYQVPHDSDQTGAEIELNLLQIITEVRQDLDIPLAVKLSPFFASFANFADRVVQTGANALVLFNRFYQPDLDVDDLSVAPRLELSQPWELRLPLRWIAMLYQSVHPRASLAATSGIHRGLDVAKALLVGADVAMTTSAVLHNGPGHVALMEKQLVEWMSRNEYESVAQLRGSVSAAAAEDPQAFERANYLKTLRSWSS